MRVATACARGDPPACIDGSLSDKMARTPTRLEPAPKIPPLTALRTVGRVARFVRPYRRQVIYAAIAGILALRGRSEVREATPPMPEQAVETTKEDVRWVKTRAQSGRRHNP